MKFLKNNLKVIIGFIVGVILTSGITVYAYSYYARDISYTKPGTTTEISVETALNDLYLKSQTLDNCEYFEFNHEENTQFNYDFGFAPSKFLAILQNYDGYKAIISYNTFNNSLYAAFTEDNDGNLSSYYSMESTKLKSNLPTNTYLYTKSYTVYVYASK